MSGPAVQWRQVLFESLGSTSDHCRELALVGEPSGLVVVSGVQLNGRGTNGRNWVSARGNLFMSILIRPDVLIADAPQLSLLAGLAVCEALTPFTSGRVNLKWPNDVLLGNAKLAGVLVETTCSSGTLDWAIIGIGVNLAIAPVLLERSTAMIGGYRSELVAAAILRSMGIWLKAVEAHGFAVVRTAWTRFGVHVLDVRGNYVSVEGSLDAPRR